MSNSSKNPWWDERKEKWLQKKGEIEATERRKGCKRKEKWMRKKGEMDAQERRRNGCERKEKWI